MWAILLQIQPNLDQVWAMHVGHLTSDTAKSGPSMGHACGPSYFRYSQIWTKYGPCMWDNPSQTENSVRAKFWPGFCCPFAVQSWPPGKREPCTGRRVLSLVLAQAPAYLAAFDRLQTDISTRVSPYTDNIFTDDFLHISCTEICVCVCVCAHHC